MISKDAFAKLHEILMRSSAEAESFRVAKYIFEDVTGTFSHYSEETLPLEKIEKLEEIQERLLEGKQWQHIVEFSDFYGLKLKVTPDVLVPRAETEEMIDWILEKTKPHETVLDIGTGNGCISLALKSQQFDLNIYALDISEKALEIAKFNSEKQELPIKLMYMNILNSRQWNKIGETRFDVIVCNPPYVLEREKTKMQHNVLDVNPSLAIFVDDNNPLLFYDVIGNFATEYLKPGGSLYFEIHEDFAVEVIDLLRQKGFSDVTHRQDMNDKDRIVLAKNYILPIFL